MMATQSEADFVRECQAYMAEHPGRLPFDRITGNLVMNWMLGRAEERATKLTGGLQSDTDHGA